VALKLKEYRSSFDRGPALADYLPYDSHDDGAFILKDGSLGMMWSLATITWSLPIIALAGNWAL
jgi:hypothetical protein